jgi:putative transposase
MHCITYELGIPIPPMIDLFKAVGVDVGITNFVYDSDVYVTPNPLNLKKMLKSLARVPRKISRRR